MKSNLLASGFIDTLLALSANVTASPQPQTSKSAPVSTGRSPASPSGANQANNGTSSTAPPAQVPALSGKAVKKCSADDKFCLTVTDGGDAVQFLLEGPKNVNKLGWIGVGLGTSMVNSDVYVSWVGPNGLVVRDSRVGASTTAPTPDQNQDAKLVQGTGTVNAAGRYSVSFVRNKKTADDVAIDTGKPIPIIWALHETAVPENGNIPKHTIKGAFTMDFNNADQLKNAGGPSHASNVQVQASTLIFMSFMALLFLM
ncbi:hypothetical protein BKA69DRAFT_1088345 [Paraphysoderma sedebokerense]|nr:hypothetical protein BKA69DRAFT_1088345 [Paraphysoderma sedebokerense]